MVGFKEERHITGDGELKFVRVTPFKDRFDEDKGYFMYSNGQTINGKAGVFFPMEILKLDIGNMAILSRHLVRNTNMIGYRGNKGIIKPMTPSNMGDVLKISERQTYRFLKKMIDVGMIAKITVEMEHGNDIQYYINPIYFLNGRNLNDGLYWLFNKFIDQHLPDWVIAEFRDRKE